MVLKPLLAACLIGSLTAPAAADPVARLVLATQSVDKTYGIYLLAPAEGCTFVRYRLSLPGRRMQTVVLRAGEGRMMRLGTGFAPGTHAVQIEAVGCAQAPVLVRQVVLNKASPDHGARALTYIKADALGEGQG